MSTFSMDRIILDARRIASRLKDREAISDSLIVEADGVNEQLDAMRRFQEDIESLNKIDRTKSNLQLINIINQENPHLREIQQENRELRACLQDHQRALEHIMSKYREHTQHKIFNSKIDFTEMNDPEQAALIKQQAEKMCEMAAVMRHAAAIDEEEANQKQELLSKLHTENKGLREALQIAQQFGSYGIGIKPAIICEDKSIQTDDTINMTNSSST